MPFSQRLQYLLEAAGFFLLIGLAMLLGLNSASAFGGFIARTIGPKTSQHRRAKQRLKRAMPETSDEEAERILKAMWDNLGRTIAELPHLGEFHPFKPGGGVDLEDHGVINKIRERKSGAILVSAHLGNWELMPNIMKEIGIPGGEVYRPANNPYVNAYIVSLRRKFVCDNQIPKGPKGVRALIDVVRSKHLVAMLVDQRMSDGVEVPFFGIPAMTPAAPAQLSLRHGVPIVPASIERIKGPHFVMRLHEPIEFINTG
ncbi:MAG: lauroyl acyltransferase, partial [Alphaproteobacteria bacterium]